jgi:hypothetical protein
MFRQVVRSVAHGFSTIAQRPAPAIDQRTVWFRDRKESVEILFSVIAGNDLGGGETIVPGFSRHAGGQ